MKIKPSGSTEWRTPAWLFDLFRRRYPFTLDLFASKKNALCKNFRSKKNRFEDMKAKEADRHSFMWANPPYGVDDITSAVKGIMELVESRRYGKRLAVVLLVPAKTDQEWWIDAFREAAHVFFIQGRMRFLKTKKKTQTAQQSHVIFVFDSDIVRRWGPMIHGIDQPDPRAKRGACFI